MKRANHKKIITLAVVAVVILAAIIVLASVGKRIALNLFEAQRKDIFGLALQLDDISFRLIPFGIKLSGIRVYPTGTEREDALMAKTDTLSLHLAPLALLKKRLHIRSVALHNPHIMFVIYKSGKSNWDVLKMPAPDAPTPAQPADAVTDGGGMEIWVDKVEIRNGEVQYRNQAEGHVLDLHHVNLTVANIRPEPDESKLPASIHLSVGAGENTRMITARGKMNPLSPTINFDIKADIAKTPITLFKSFYEKKSPLAVTDGYLKFASTATAKQDILDSAHRVEIEKLKVGGAHGAVINTLMLDHAEKLSFDFTVKGNLKDASFSVGAALAENISKNILALTKGIGAGVIKAVPKVVDTPIKAIDEGLKGIFGGSKKGK